jgi:hypothetical protein
MKYGGNASGCFRNALVFPPFFMSVLVGRLAGRCAARWQLCVSVSSVVEFRQVRFIDY